MEPDPTYRVQFTGHFLNGVAPESAISAFAAMAKISPAQASTLLGQARVLKKRLDIKTAHTYRNKLEAIGLGVTVQPEAAEKAPLELTLEPITDRYGSQNQTPSGNIVCPKCGHEQKSAAQCESCGVFIHKVKAKLEPIPDGGKTTNAEDAPLSNQMPDSEVSQEALQDPKPVAILAAVAVAVICAYVWKLIAIATGYELGFVAWGIGGAIGFAALALGSIGMRTGILCGVLALCSIIGGKYLVQQSFMDEITEQLQSALSDESMAQAYQAQQEMARHFVNDVYTDADMRQFMVDYGYTDAEDSAAVTDEELTDFKGNEVPSLQDYANGTVDDLSAMDGSELAEPYMGISTWDAVKESLGPIDLLFFFLGIGTAFRLGAYGRKV